MAESLKYKQCLKKYFSRTKACAQYEVQLLILKNSYLHGGGIIDLSGVKAPK